MIRRGHKAEPIQSVAEHRQAGCGVDRGSVPIHEHINLYPVKSIARMIESAGLQIVDIEAVFLDLGWIKTTNVRALGRKNGSR